MDDPEVDPRELAGNFDDIERANRMFGGIAPVVREVFSRKTEWVLDVGCGSGDIARALIREARRRGRRLEIVCVDHSEAALEIARERTRAEHLIRFTSADAMALPFPDNSFDVATCNLTLHHFSPDEAVHVLRELRRVSRMTPLVCDLRRSLVSYFAAVVFVMLFAKNRLTKHDGPLSARRAYTPREALGLAEEAGWNAPRVTRLPWERMLLYDDGD
jgi:ubiquinone/menaquinone biosynthesis C-methylase UbiE